MLHTVLYAEVYAICFIVAGLLLFWSTRSDVRSSAEQWLIALFFGCLGNFGINLCFTVVNGILPATPVTEVLGYAFKSLYFASLSVLVFFWCGYAETELRTEKPMELRVQRRMQLMFFVPFLVPVALVVWNLWSHDLFYLKEGGGYLRGPAYHWIMAYLFALTAICSCRHLRRSFREFDPIRKAHMRLTASFPLALLAAWLLSLLGEALPVICVCLMLEILCLYVGSSRQQISLDKLTQVNNRQNLISFLNYKLSYHESQLFLLMIDVDYFKSINDTFGHLEGDSALIRVSSSLKQACANYKIRPYIARYGGDEFIVLIEGTREEADALRDNIRAILKEKQAANSLLHYPLEVSVGMAKCQSGMTADALIAAADEDLYRIKRNRPPRKE